MMDLILALPLMLFSFGRDWDFDDWDDKITGSSSALEIARDSTFANKTNEFSAGQTVYVRVTADNDGQDKHVLNLRDNNYNLITTYSMNKNGNQFLVNFPAPSSAGIYSVEVNIVSSGSVANYVQTIEVGGGVGNSIVSVNVTNQVNTGNQTSSTSGESEPTPEVLGTVDRVGNQPASTPGVEGAHTPGVFSAIWVNILKFFAGFF
jgi:hypothetical protein